MVDEMNSASGWLTYPERLDVLAAERGHEPAITLSLSDGSESTLSWCQLAARSSAGARELAAVGADAKTLIVVALPNGAEWYVACLAAWRVGATVLPLDPRLPDAA